MRVMSVPVGRPGADEGLRLLNVHAHPDDESSKGAATTLRYVAEGARVMVATCTGGERGSVLNPKMDRSEIWENITEVRRREMRTAREILGVEHRSLGYVDSGLPEDPAEQLPRGCFGLTDPVEAAGPLVRIIREFRPQVMTTYDENGGYPHPDHIQCHRVSIAAFRMAADPDALPETGPAWQVSKLYYQVGFHRARYAALDEAMAEAGLGHPYAERLAQWSDHDYEQRVTTRVPCGEFFERSDDALRAHASQVDPDGFWFQVPVAIRQRVWPTEDYQLVYSAVPTRMPETDLFAGLRGGAEAPDPADTWVI